LYSKLNIDLRKLSMCVSLPQSVWMSQTLTHNLVTGFVFGRWLMHFSCRKISVRWVD